MIKAKKLVSSLPRYSAINTNWAIGWEVLQVKFAKHLIFGDFVDLCDKRNTEDEHKPRKRKIKFCDFCVMFFCCASLPKQEQPTEVFYFGPSDRKTKVPESLKEWKQALEANRQQAAAAAAATTTSATSNTTSTNNQYEAVALV
jgi:hypothetical protein